ncbi:ABC transporter permease [Clostridium sp. D5]|uniref:ABC transporter permease n=1 Tax=Clostridium sp. D5 TaxID=556261 RepID=UPI0001FC8325|nr:ABC transporter permease [Clostridium sp. D5]EGB91191.1 ribose ABC transporter, permease protein [Clostridium sp. D5]
MMEAQKKKIDLKRLLIQNNTYIILLILFIVCCVLSSNFLTVMNIRNIALQQAAPVCVAVGMLFVILTGGIDLSVGSIMALGACVTATMMAEHGMNMFVGIIAAMLMGCILGGITGFFVAYTKMQGFVASLAMMTMARGAAFMLTDGIPVKLEKGTLDVLVKKEYGYPIILCAALIVLLFWFIQKYTSYGRIVIALGSNSTAVELAGIRVKRYLLSVYAISGCLAALAGIFIAARSSTGSPTVGDGQELDAITACVIGGANLAGGKGTVIKTLMGAFVLALIGNIMNLMAVPSYPQDIIKGCIIIAAVLLQLFTEKSEQTV